MEYIVIDGKGKKVSKEDYEIDNITHETIDEKVYKDHLEKVEDPECWWSLDELKKLWHGKLTFGGKKVEG